MQMYSYSLEREVFRLLRTCDKTLAIAESCTAGLLSGRLVGSNPGISKYYKGGVVTYTVASKVEVLSISRDQIHGQGVVSEYTAREMAKRVRILLQTDIGFGVTGSAGPTAEPGSRVGDFCLAMAIGDSTLLSETFYRPDLSRAVFIDEVIAQSLKLIIKHIY